MGCPGTSAHCVGMDAGSLRYAVQSGVGTAAPMQVSVDWPPTSPVASNALATRFDEMRPRNSPTPPRTIQLCALKPPKFPPPPPPPPPRPPCPPPPCALPP